MNPPKPPLWLPTRVSSACPTFRIISTPPLLNRGKVLEKSGKSPLLPFGDSCYLYRALTTYRLFGGNKNDR